MFRNLQLTKTRLKLSKIEDVTKAPGIIKDSNLNDNEKARVYFEYHTVVGVMNKH